MPAIIVAVLWTVASWIGIWFAIAWGCSSIGTAAGHHCQLPLAREVFLFVTVLPLLPLSLIENGSTLVDFLLIPMISSGAVTFVVLIVLQKATTVFRRGPQRRVTDKRPITVARAIRQEASRKR